MRKISEKSIFQLLPINSDPSLVFLIVYIARRKISLQSRKSHTFCPQRQTRFTNFTLDKLKIVKIQEKTQSIIIYSLLRFSFNVNKKLWHRVIWHFVI